MKNTVSVAHAAESPLLWAGLGMLAGGLALWSPWLGLIAGAGAMVGAALVSRRRRKAPIPLEPGDLATPWPEGMPERVRREVSTVWQGLTEVHERLYGLLSQLEAQQREWHRRLALAETNAETISRATYAQQGAIRRALEAVSAGARQWEAVSQRWEQANDQLVELRDRDRQQRAMAGEIRHQFDALQQSWDGVLAAVEHVQGHLAEPGAAFDTEAWASLIARADALADEAARLGKPGWGVALAATEWAADARQALADIPPRDTVSPAPAASELMASLVGVEHALATMSEALAALDTEPFDLAALDALPVIGLDDAADRLDGADHEGGLSAGAAQALLTTLGDWRRRAHRLVDAVGDVRHQAAAALILSGYVRTSTGTAPCHLHRTVWCIAEADCERCPLTQLSEADFPEFFGAARGRHAPQARRTGRTIDLDPASGLS